MHNFKQASGLEMLKLEFILKLKIKRNDWLFADTSPQAANQCTLFEFDRVHCTHSALYLQLCLFYLQPAMKWTMRNLSL